MPENFAHCGGESKGFPLKLLAAGFARQETEFFCSLYCFTIELVPFNTLLFARGLFTFPTKLSSTVLVSVFAVSFVRLFLLNLLFISISRY
jgi:hypothetical protein